MVERAKIFSDNVSKGLKAFPEDERAFSFPKKSFQITKHTRWEQAGIQKNRDTNSGRMLSIKLQFVVI